MTAGHEHERTWQPEKEDAGKDIEWMIQYIIRWEKNTLKEKKI